LNKKLYINPKAFVGMKIVLEIDINADILNSSHLLKNSFVDRAKQYQNISNRDNIKRTLIARVCKHIKDDRAQSLVEQTPRASLSDIQIGLGLS
jgi:hypothetical protein